MKVKLLKLIANDIIDWCEANAPQALSGTRSSKRKERGKSKPTLY